MRRDSLPVTLGVEVQLYPDWLPSFLMAASTSAFGSARAAVMVRNTAPKERRGESSVLGIVLVVECGIFLSRSVPNTERNLWRGCCGGPGGPGEDDTSDGPPTCRMLEPFDRVRGPRLSELRARLGRVRGCNWAQVPLCPGLIWDAV